MLNIVVPVPQTVVILNMYLFFSLRLQQYIPDFVHSNRIDPSALWRYSTSSMLLSMVILWFLATSLSDIMFAILFGLYQTYPNPFNLPILSVVVTPLLQWMVMHWLFGAFLISVRRAWFAMMLHPAPLSLTSHSSCVLSSSPVMLSWVFLFLSIRSTFREKRTLLALSPFANENERV